MRVRRYSTEELDELMAVIAQRIRSLHSGSIALGPRILPDRAGSPNRSVDEPNLAKHRRYIQLSLLRLRSLPDALYWQW